ncbi:MAG: hypothetical protein EHM35_04245 [Planctomycetaceae bacterium]|nr:MAG: hypothetical protein EHM35_04245 [Planctomycetaceae bacterium]
MHRLLVIGSIVFPAYVLATIVVILLLPLFADMDSEIPPKLVMPVILAIVLLFISVAGIWFFIIFDIVHVARNDRFSGGVKAGWICAIWFLNIFSIPVYALKHLRKPMSRAISPVSCDSV